MPPPSLSFSELPYSVIFPLPVWISSPGCQRRPELTRHRTVHVRQQPTGATGQWIKKKAQPEAKKSRRHNLRTILHLCNPTCAQLPRCLCSPAAPTPPCQWGQTKPKLKVSTVIYSPSTKHTLCSYISVEKRPYSIYSGLREMKVFLLFGWNICP